MPSAAFALKDTSGKFYCTRCLTSGFSNEQAVLGHRHGKSCKQGLAGVSAAVGDVLERNSTVDSRSVGTAPETAQATVQPFERSGNSPKKPSWRPLSLGGTARPVPFSVEATPPTAHDLAGNRSGVCEGCLSLASELRQLREDMHTLSGATLNHLAHAQLELAQVASSGPSPLLVVAGLAAAGLLGAWMCGAFDDGEDGRGAKMGDASALSKTAGAASGLATVLDVAGKGARLYKSLRGIF